MIPAHVAEATLRLPETPGVYLWKAADGTVLADSLPTSASGTTYQREYPLGSLTAGVVGYYSPALDSSWGLEEEYSSYLTAHTQPAQNFELSKAVALSHPPCGICKAN